MASMSFKCLLLALAFLNLRMKCSSLPEVYIPFSIEKEPSPATAAFSCPRVCLGF